MTDSRVAVMSVFGEQIATVGPPRSQWVEADFRGWAAKVCEQVNTSGLHPLKCWAATGLTRGQWGALLRHGAKVDGRVAAALEDDDASDVGSLSEFDVSCLRLYVEVMSSYSEVELLAGSVVKEKMLDGSLGAVAAWREHAAKEEAEMLGVSGSGGAGSVWGAPQAVAAVLGVFMPPAAPATSHSTSSIEVDSVER